MPETIQLGERLSKGAEHHVFRDAEDPDYLYKLPAAWSFWQNMTPELADRDLGILKAYGVPIAPTEVLEEGAEVIYPDGKERPKKYVLRQKYIPNARPLNTEDLEDPEILAQIDDMMEKIHRIYMECDLGVDVLGGKAIKELIKLIYTSNIQAEAYNMLLDEDKKVWLCDTRLYDFNFGFLPGLSLGLRQVQRFQYEIMGRFIDQAHDHNGNPNNETPNASGVVMSTIGNVIHRIAKWRLATSP